MDLFIGNLGYQKDTSFPYPASPQKEIWSYGWPYARWPSYGHRKNGHKMAEDLRYPLYDQLMAIVDIGPRSSYGQRMICECAVGPPHGHHLHDHSMTTTWWPLYGHSSSSLVKLTTSLQPKPIAILQPSAPLYSIYG